MYKLGIIILVAFALGCSSKKALIGEDLSISMAKGACFGSCPVYDIKVDHTGKAIYNGERFTSKVGKHSLQLTKAEFESLVTAFEAADLSKYKDMYESEIADLPTIKIGYTNNGKSKSVKGKHERPEKIKDLQALLEKIVDSDQWISLEPVSSTEEEVAEEEVVEEEVIIKEQLIIKFKPGTIISRWLKEYRSNKLYVNKPLDPERTTWLVNFDSSTVEPQALLDEIAGDPAVESVEFNKEVKNR